MSTPTRTLRNLWRLGPRMAWRQMQYIGDTKYGKFVAEDKYGNKFYENEEEELPLRTRWVDYKDHEFDPSQIEPGWHAWMAYMTHDPPSKDPLTQTMVRSWEVPYHKPNLTSTRAYYRPFNTVKPKMATWKPVAAPRGA